MRSQEGQNAPCGAGIVGEGDSFHHREGGGEAGEVLLIAVYQGTQYDFLGYMLSFTNCEELHAVEHVAFGVAVAGAEAVGARLQLDGGGEGGHAGVVLEVEGAEITVLEFLEGEVGVVDGGGGLFAMIGEGEARRTSSSSIASCTSVTSQAGFLPIGAIPDVDGVGGVVEVGGDVDARQAATKKMSRLWASAWRSRSTPMGEMGQL